MRGWWWSWGDVWVVLGRDRDEQARRVPTREPQRLTLRVLLWYQKYACLCLLNRRTHDCVEWCAFLSVGPTLSDPRLSNIGLSRRCLEFDLIGGATFASIRKSSFDDMAATAASRPSSLASIRASIGCGCGGVGYATYDYDPNYKYGTVHIIFLTPRYS